MENSVKDLYYFLVSSINDTNNSLVTEEHLLNYWKGNGPKERDAQPITKGELDYYTSNANDKVASLKFRLEWLETQLSSIRETYGKK